MKISKIFHTLYGFLMCLPIISILFVCVYVSVNPNAKDSYSGTEIQYRQVEYHTNEVNSIDDLIVGNVYVINYNIRNYSNNPVILCEAKCFQFLNFTLPSFVNDNNYYSFLLDTYTSSVIFRIYETNSVTSNALFYFGFCNTNIDESRNVYYPFIYNGYLDNNFSYINLITIADLSLIPPQYEEIEVQKLDNAFYYSVNEINDNPLFSWAQNSFLVAPITYVVSLFGMTNTSPIVTMLSYWLTISIIWLVFDLIMYIPLLVHRWIDKGVVE